MTEFVPLPKPIVLESQKLGMGRIASITMSSDGSKITSGVGPLMSAATSTWAFSVLMGLDNLRPPSRSFIPTVMFPSRLTARRRLSEFW